MKYTLITAALAVGILALLVSIRLAPEPFGTDSAEYIEQARSILAGNGSQARPFEVDDELDCSLQPTHWFPPGYPAAIAVGAFATGASTETVAPWVNRVALVILPLVIYLAIRSIIGDYYAAYLGLLGGLSPGVINFGQFALSDVLSVMVVVVSSGLILTAWSSCKKLEALSLAFVGGLLSGYAYLIRHQNIAFIISIPIILAFWLIVSHSREERIKTLRTCLGWALGSSIVVLPWCVRNLILFGSIHPYDATPSPLSGWDSFRGFVNAQVSDIVGSPDFGARFGLMALVILTVSIAVLLLRYWPRVSNEQRKALTFSIGYTLIGSAIVIVYAAIMFGGDEFSRFTLQYTPFILLLIGITIRNVFSGRKASIILCFAVTILWGISRIITIAPSWTCNSVEAAVYDYIADLDYDRFSTYANDGDPLIVSNYAYLYRIVHDADALHPRHEMKDQSIKDVLDYVHKLAGNKSVIIAFHPTENGAIKPEDLPLQRDAVTALTEEGWHVVENSELALILVLNNPPVLPAIGERKGPEQTTPEEASESKDEQDSENEPSR
ncbi:MAG: hypothetical protein ACLQVJ_04125 [Syntrophobacteraceae bacterium]